MSTASGMTGRPANLEILAPDFRVDSAVVREAADRHWYAKTQLGPAILTYEDCLAFLHDRRFVQASTGHLAEQGITTGPLAELWAAWLLNIDGGDHHRLRRLVAPGFSPAGADALRVRMREIVDGLLDGLAGTGRCEFISAFADHYPPRVIFDLLGIPAAEHEQFLRYGSALAKLIGYDVVTHHDEIAAAILGIDELIDRLVDERTRTPGEDLLSKLVGAGDGDDRLTRAEIRALASIMVFAGQDSTRCSLGNALTLFAEHPDQWALLAERPELAAAAVDEVLRVRAVCPIIWRQAAEDLEYKDLRLSAGERVWLLVGHGQLYDADGRPDPFDITAEHRPHLNFGHGTHFCLGAALARAELAEALPLLARRMPDLALDGTPVRRPELAGFVGVEHLPIRFTALPA